MKKLLMLENYILRNLIHVEKMIKEQDDICMEDHYEGQRMTLSDTLDYIQFIKKEYNDKEL
jgi:hypothetical protein